MLKRSGKWYRSNEAKVMKRLGFIPTKNSGSGWVEKEDGANEGALCQLKSTDKQSIKVNKVDLDTLAYNAAVSHKIPVFAVQFIGDDDVWLMLKPEDIESAAKYISSGTLPPKGDEELLQLGQDSSSEARGSVIRSSKRAREKFASEQQSKYRKKGKSAI